MRTESLHRHHRRCLDAAIRRAFVSIQDPFIHGSFAFLLELARARSDLLHAAPTIVGGAPRFGAVVALRQLAAWHHERRGALDAWAGARGHPLAIVDSLARAAFGGYATPRFLASVWFASDRVHQGWWIGHARGVAFRRLPLPIALTRAMEHELLAFPDDAALVPSLRRAEVLGLVDLVVAAARCHRRRATDRTERAGADHAVGRARGARDRGVSAAPSSAPQPTISYRSRCRRPRSPCGRGRPTRSDRDRRRSTSR